MNKVLLGLLLGALLGAIDGATAWFTPEVRNQMLGIIVGSTIKGMLAGLAAGWFARKVHNVAAGLIFGLAVGALLAYGVCQMQGGKYYFEIMLPGSIVGAIVGWATQRYGVSAKRGTAVATVISALSLLLVINAGADETKSITAVDAFAKLKSLEGKWTAPPLAPNTPPVVVRYHVASGGTTVQETLFEGSPHEMITMYTVDGDELVATHYCAAGNQPSFKLNRAKSTKERLIFDNAGLRGKGVYIHDGWIAFPSDGKIAEEWLGYDANGTPAPKPHHFDLTRAQ